MHRAGDVVGERYEIHELIAVGGMGTVYRARHTVSGRDVALKIIHPHLTVDPQFEERFRREARASAEIGHEAIVEVLDAGRDQHGALYLAMELLDGESLRAHLERPGTTRGQALAWIDGLLEPLGAAHERGFVHRDLKPENAFVARGRDGRESVKLLDFGIAKQLGQDALTATGAALGTPHYMPPEQVFAREVGPPADVWSIGVMLYEILSGTPPFTGPTPQAAFAQACTAKHRPLPEVAPGVGPKLSSLVDRALDKDPSRRPKDAWTLRAELRDALLEDPDASHCVVSLTSSTPPPRMPTTPARVRGRSTPPIDAWTEHRGERFTIRLPPAFHPQTSSVPAVVLYAELAEPTALALEARVTLRIKVEPFDGDTRTYADLGLSNMEGIARIHRTSDAKLGGHDAVEVDATLAAAEPPVRTLHRVSVVDGMGYVVQLSAPPSRFADLAPTLRAILGTMRIGA